MHFIDSLLFSFIVGGAIGLIVGLYYFYLYLKKDYNFLNELAKKDQKNKKYTFSWYFSELLNEKSKYIKQKLNFCDHLYFFKIESSFFLKKIYSLYSFCKKYINKLILYLKDVFVN